MNVSVEELKTLLADHVLAGFCKDKEIARLRDDVAKLSSMLIGKDKPNQSADAKASE